MRIRYQFLIVALFVAIAADGLARGPFYSESVPARSGRKFTRGFLNTVFFWAEIPKEVNRDWQNVDPLTGVFTGTGKGLYKGAQRFGVGVYEMVTFPVDTPANYQPIVYPETVMEDGYDWGAEDYYRDQRTSKITH
ncbi:MAG: exosortase system-associated protein, TIGR04073 family [Candidatus Sumerlaeaceae bacterium]|nr:exosortase system-associated protein, TIGR04073 family [Candidatus Sumerlaeaceae bacterium]